MLNESEIEKLYQQYVSNNYFLWFKDFDQSEQFFQYLCKNKLVINTIRHGAFRSEKDGWGYAVRETI